jgi:hypothetical protein
VSLVEADRMLLSPLNGSKLLASFDVPPVATLERVLPVVVLVACLTFASCLRALVELCLA